MIDCQLLAGNGSSAVTRLSKFMLITTRRAIPEDLEWLDRLYERLMRPYVELTHEWKEEVFRENFSPDRMDIIQVDGVDAGMLSVVEKTDHIYIADMQLAETYQRRGIGSDLITRVIESARERHLPVRLRVLIGNPAIHLYKRHGFNIVEELDNCFVLECST